MPWSRRAFVMAAAWLGFAAAAPARACCPIVELRQYTLKPRQRDVLIDLFEREFIESQEAQGMSIIGQFRDLDDPDRFVWLRGFPDMTTRARALAAFYGGPVRKAHRTAANTTMIDSDDVLLLRPLARDAGFALDGVRAPIGAAARPRPLVTATICLLHRPPGDDFMAWYEREMRPTQAAAGARPLATLTTEYSANNFPALPVRENEHAFAWFSAFADPDAHASHVAKRDAAPRWQKMMEFLRPRLKSDPQTLRLSPTPRSLLPGPSSTRT